jgi:amidase
MGNVHAFGDDALGQFDAVDLVERLESGEVSVSELIEAAITRTEAINPALNGLAYAAFGRARTRARAGQASHRGFFDGVPTFIKDQIDVAGMPTMQGTDAWQPHPAAADGDFARMYLATGLVPLGKTRLPEFGLCPAAEHPRLGPVRNPWNTDYTAGGSSAGSAAFVAAGVVPIAHGMDGGGSIRIPASCTGLVGLKPSRGRLPLDRMFRLMPVQIAYNGVLTRSVRDTAAFYREAERIWHNPKLPPIGDVRHAGKQRLKIAMITRSIRREASPEVCELTMKTAALLEELGHRVVKIDAMPMPAHFADDFVLYNGMLTMALVRGGRHTFGPSFDRTKLHNLPLGLDHHASRNLHRLPLAIMRLRSLRQHTARFFRSYDAMLTPTLPDKPPRVGHLDLTADYQQIIDQVIALMAFTPLQNVTGEPAISLPLGESAAGLPLGVMLSASIGSEARLLELAYELEQARPWRRIHSDAGHRTNPDATCDTSPKPPLIT